MDDTYAYNEDIHAFTKLTETGSVKGKTSFTRAEKTGFDIDLFYEFIRENYQWFLDANK